MIENKWKRFAISQTLSDWGDIDSAELFDRLTETDSDGLEYLFDQFGIVVWEPFCEWDNMDVAKQIYTLAASAQEAEND